MSRELELIGKLAWRAYTAHTGVDPNVELVPEWLDVPQGEREAWGAAAQAVAEEFKRRTQDVFFGYTAI